MADKTQAQRVLDSMKGSLREWLHYRSIMDDAAAGKIKSPLSPEANRNFISSTRDFGTEAALAKQLKGLLSITAPGTALPDDAAELGKLVVNPPKGLVAQGDWQMPLIIAGAVALVLMSGISSLADVAKEKERIACINAGNCTDSGFYIKAGAIAVGIYVLYKMEVFSEVKGMFKSWTGGAKRRLRR